ncbi:hypothetical protein RIF29_24087 [Crotalaria pallida]|uniref:Uncharacterized protein n=1 Tax=Crotalaria pallida TaxID=3830 RepID=A0AAN9EJQ0_CROPI
MYKKSGSTERDNARANIKKISQRGKNDPRGSRRTFINMMENEKSCLNQKMKLMGDEMSCEKVIACVFEMSGGGGGDRWPERRRESDREMRVGLGGGEDEAEHEHERRREKWLKL